MFKPLRKLGNNLLDLEREPAGGSARYIGGDKNREAEGKTVARRVAEVKAPPATTSRPPASMPPPSPSDLASGLSVQKSSRCQQEARSRSPGRFKIIRTDDCRVMDA
jgi:hypothetical protein